MGSLFLSFGGGGSSELISPVGHGFTGDGVDLAFRIANRNYLVGSRPINFTAIQREIGRSSYQIQLRFLGEDVPLSVLWDRKRCQYVSYSPELSYLGKCFQLRLS
jgi:hypothetical protein